MIFGDALRSLSAGARRTCSALTGGNTSTQVQTQTCSFTPSRLAHTYGRQQTGLYGGAHIQFGNSVAESKVKTRRRFLPNVHPHTLYSKTLQRPIRIRIATRVMRTIKKYGGLDEYLTAESKGIQKTLGLRGEELRAEILFTRQMQQMIEAEDQALRETTQTEVDGQAETSKTAATTTDADAAAPSTAA
ncbi:hypothetical protein PYCC9005_000196 [Savitreella phatthalungensis]